MVECRTTALAAWAIESMAKKALQNGGLLKLRFPRIGTLEVYGGESLERYPVVSALGTFTRHAKQIKQSIWCVKEFCCCVRKRDDEDKHRTCCACGKSWARKFFNALGRRSAQMNTNEPTLNVEPFRNYQCFKHVASCWKDTVLP